MKNEQLIGHNLIEIIRSRRSVRRYLQKPIDAEDRQILIEALLRAPSSRNLQPWEFIVVDDQTLLQQLSHAKEHGSQFLSKAALGIVICADSRKSDVWIEDCSIAAFLVHLTAHALGLGSCWIQIRRRNHSETITAERYVRKILGIPGYIKVEAIVSIGHPAEQKKPVPASALRYDRVRLNGYGDAYDVVTEHEKNSDA
jgi:nitroreductase